MSHPTIRRSPLNASRVRVRLLAVSLALCCLVAACGGCGSDQPRREDVGVAPRAVGRPMVEGPGGAAPLEAEEEARFVEATAQITCLVLERTAGREVSRLEVMTPELLDEAAGVLARHGIEPARYDALQRACQGHESVSRTIYEHTHQRCPRLVDPAGVPRQLGAWLGEGMKWRRAPMGGMLGPASEPRDEQEGIYLEVSAALGCMALEGTVSPEARQRVLNSHGLDEASFIVLGRAMRNRPEVVGQLATMLKRCPGTP